MLETLLIAQLWSAQPERFQCHEPLRASGGSETHNRNLLIPADVEFLQFQIQLYGIVDSYSVVLPGQGAVTEAYKISGYHTETFPVPLEVKQGRTVRIQVVGNPDNPGTQWNYTLSCFEPSVGRNEPVALGFDRIQRVPHRSGGETMQAILVFESLPEEDICIVERLTLENTEGNRISSPPLPFESNRDDAFMATWGTSDCPRLYSSQKKPAPGGITPPNWLGRNVYPITGLSMEIVTPLNLGSLADSHGTALLCQNMDADGEHITRQRFYWYRPNNPDQLYRLRYKSGEMVETTIKRRYLPETAEQEIIFQNHQGTRLGAMKLPAINCQ
jgi:hypothetical protein